MSDTVVIPLHDVDSVDQVCKVVADQVASGSPIEFAIEAIPIGDTVVGGKYAFDSTLAADPELVALFVRGYHSELLAKYDEVQKGAIAHG